MRISGVTVFGPLEENDPIIGAGFIPNSALGDVIKPIGFLIKKKKNIAFMLGSLNNEVDLS